MRNVMRAAYVVTAAAALAGSTLLFTTAGAAERCDTNCVGPACSTDCVREPGATVGQDRREGVTIEERNRRREPGVEIREGAPPRSGADVEIRR
jgi:hypothetical protein